MPAHQAVEAQQALQEASGEQTQPHNHHPEHLILPDDMAGALHEADQQHDEEAQKRDDADMPEVHAPSRDT